MTQNAASILAQPLPEFSNLLYVPVIGTFRHIFFQFDLDAKAKELEPIFREANSHIQTQARGRLREIGVLNIQLCEAAQSRTLGTIVLIVGCLFISTFSLLVGGILIGLNLFRLQNYKSQADQLMTKIEKLDRQLSVNQSASNDDDEKAFLDYLRTEGLMKESDGSYTIDEQSLNNEEKDFLNYLRTEGLLKDSYVNSN